MEREKTLFDFFISYKRKDTSEIVEPLASILENRGYDVWLDKLEVKPGDSILASIERGISNSLSIILVFSQNYFEGWSEHERRAAFNLATSKKVHMVPIWYKIDHSFILKNAPMFADISAISYDNNKIDPILEIGNQLSSALRPSDKRSKLFEFYFKCLYKAFPNDPDLKMWVGLIDNNIDLLKEGLDNGADPNATDTSIYNKYARESIDCGCFDEWRKLYLFFHSEGQLRNQENRP